nr:zinc finger protein 485-like [Marmota flaviventris]
MHNRKSLQKRNCRCRECEEPGQCRRCGKGFRNSSALTKHCRVPPGKKPYRCPRCGRTFNQMAPLTQHRRTHGAPSPTRAGTVGRLRFQPVPVPAPARGSSRTQRQRAHSGHKPYACRKCGKTFSRATQRVQHQGVHRGRGRRMQPVRAAAPSARATVSAGTAGPAGGKPEACCGHLLPGEALRLRGLREGLRPQLLPDPAPRTLTGETAAWVLGTGEP